MEFITYYQNISDKTGKRKLRNEIIDSCKIQHSTFYSWFSRKAIPLLAQEKISELLQKSQSELFPENKDETISN